LAPTEFCVVAGSMLSVVLAPPRPSRSTPPFLGALACAKRPLARRPAAATLAESTARRLMPCFKDMCVIAVTFLGCGDLSVHLMFLANEIKNELYVRIFHKARLLLLRRFLPTADLRMIGSAGGGRRCVSENSQSMKVRTRGERLSSRR
jgi:hypothetical protein